jgi:hypothetical protein
MSSPLVQAPGTGTQISYLKMCPNAFLVPEVLLARDSDEIDRRGHVDVRPTKLRSSSTASFLMVCL